MSRPFILCIILTLLLGMAGTASAHPHEPGECISPDPTNYSPESFAEVLEIYDHMIELGDFNAARRVAVTIGDRNLKTFRRPSGGAYLGFWYDEFGDDINAGKFITPDIDMGPETAFQLLRDYEVEPFVSTSSAAWNKWALHSAVYWYKLAGMPKDVIKKRLAPTLDDAERARAYARTGMKWVYFYQGESNMAQAMEALGPYAYDAPSVSQESGRHSLDQVETYRQLEERYVQLKATGKLRKAQKAEVIAEQLGDMSLFALGYGGYYLPVKRRKDPIKGVWVADIGEIQHAEPWSEEALYAAVQWFLLARKGNRINQKLEPYLERAERAYEAPIKVAKDIYIVAGNDYRREVLTELYRIMRPARRYEQEHPEVTDENK